MATRVATEGGTTVATDAPDGDETAVEPLALTTKINNAASKDARAIRRSLPDIAERKNENRHIVTALVAAVDLIASHLGYGLGPAGELDVTDPAFTNIALNPDQRGSKETPPNPMEDRN